MSTKYSFAITILKNSVHVHMSLKVGYGINLSRVWVVAKFIHRISNFHRISCCWSVSLLCFLTLLRVKASSRSFVMFSFPTFADFLVGAGKNVGTFSESTVVDLFVENVLGLLFAALDGLNVECDQGREWDVSRLGRGDCITRLQVCTYSWCRLKAWQRNWSRPCIKVRYMLSTFTNCPRVVCFTNPSSSVTLQDIENTHVSFLYRWHRMKETTH